MLFDNRNTRSITNFTDNDREFSRFCRCIGLRNGNSGIVVSSSGCDFLTISTDDWKETSDRHKNSLLSQSVYNWNNYAVFGYLKERGLMNDFFAAPNAVPTVSTTN